jgi:membrane-associated phospholipid phosphatase
LLALILATLILSRLRRHIGRLEVFADRLASTPPAAWVRRRFPRQVAWWRRRLDVGNPRGFWLTFTIVVGALATWTFSGLTQDVVGNDESVLFDPRFETWVLTHRTPWLTSVMKTVTWLGSTAVIVPLLIGFTVAMIARRRDWRSPACLATAFVGAVALSNIVKPAVGRLRPPPTTWIGHYSGGSFPSGHATQAIAFYGMLAAILSIGRPSHDRMLLWLGAAGVTLLVGASRIYLGAHWLTDVLSGYALGAAWVAIIVVVMLLTTSPERGGPLAATADRETPADRHQAEGNPALG